MIKKSRKSTFFLATGLLLLAAALCLALYNWMDSNRAGAASEQVLHALTDAIIQRKEEPDSHRPLPDPSSDKERAPGEMAAYEVDGYAYIGVLEIPELKLSLPVMEQWDYTRLTISPCRYTGSYLTDDLVICAHNYATHFNPIRWIALYTDVYFTTIDGITYHYQVSDRQTLQPTDISKMVDDEAGEWELTLFTCNTGGQTRCAVRCQRVDEIPHS